MKLICWNCSFSFYEQELTENRCISGSVLSILGKVKYICASGGLLAEVKIKVQSQEQEIEWNL